MSIFSRRKIEIDPEDHELVTRMSAQSSETSLFQTETINITKIGQEARNTSDGHTAKSKKRDYRPSRMSDSFMSTSFKEKHFQEEPKQNVVLAEYRRIQEELEELDQIRPLDADFKFEKPFEEPEVLPKKKRGITSEFDQKELTDYIKKTHRVNRFMVSLIVTAIVIIVAISIVMLILNLRKSGQTSPLGGV